MNTSLDTRFGSIKSSQSGSDVLSNLTMAFEGTFAAQNGKLGLAVDALYVNLENTKQTPLQFYGSGTVGLKMSAVSG